MNYVGDLGRISIRRRYVSIISEWFNEIGKKWVSTIAAINCDVLETLFAGKIRLRQIVQRPREGEQRFYYESKYMIGYLWRRCYVDTPKFDAAFLSRVGFEIHLHLIVTKKNPRVRIDVDGHRYMMITLEMPNKSSTKIEC